MLNNTIFLNSLAWGTLFLQFYNLCAGADVDGNEVMKGQIDKDGLPYIGRYMTFGEPYYRYYVCDKKILNKCKNMGDPLLHR